MANNRHKIPANLVPDDDKCIPLYVPDDKDYQALLLGALRPLAQWTHYELDEQKNARVVADVFAQRTYHRLLDSLAENEPCGDDDVGYCSRFDTLSNTYDIYPNDPFLSEDAEPTFFQAKWYTFPQWIETGEFNVGEIIFDFFFQVGGYFDDDLIVAIGGEIQDPFFEFGKWLAQFTNFPAPYIHIDMIGSGRFEIEILNVPIGCYCLIVPDGQNILDTVLSAFQNFIDNGANLPDKWLFFETNRAIGETSSSFIQPVDFEDDGNHTIDVFWFPRLDVTQPPFIFPLGGWRNFEVCGNLKVVGFDNGEVYDRSNFKQATRTGALRLMTTASDLKNAVCEGMKCYTIDTGIALSASAQSGLLDNITVDENGNIVFADLQNNGQGGFENNQELAYGRAIAVSNGINEYFDRLNDYVEDATVSDVLAEQFLNSLYQLNVGVTQAIADMNTFETNATNKNIFPISFADKLYGEGTTKQVLSEVILDLDLAEITLTVAWLSAIEALTDEQLSVWQELATPTTIVYQSSYYKYPSFQVEVNAAELSVSNSFPIADSLIWSNFLKKFRVSVTGEIQFSDGRSFDGFYLKSGSSKTYKPIRLYETGNSLGKSIPFFDASIFVGQDAIFNEGVQAGIDANWTMDRLSIEISAVDYQLADSGQLTYTFTDLGEA